MLRRAEQLRLGAGDGDGTAGQGRLQPLRPDLGRALDGGDALAGRLTPAPPGDLAEAAGGGARHHRLDVVHRRVGDVGRGAAQFGHGAVVAVVPAPGRQVDAAGEGEHVVDADDLLVVGAAQRVAGVEAQVDARMVGPAAAREGGGRLARIERPHRPDEDVDVQPVMRLDQRAQHFAQRRHVDASRAEPDLRVEVPADDPDVAARQRQAGGEPAEIFGAVDEEGEAARLGDAPGIGARHGDRPF